MKKLFIDASFFIALSDTGDRHFDEARNCFLEQVGDGVKLMTSNMVVSETLTWLRYRAGFKYAKQFGEKFRGSKIIDTIWIDSDLEKTAWEIFVKYSDKELSYVDCLSFACMKTLRIGGALAFDRHFQQVGLQMLPGSL